MLRFILFRSCAQPSHSGQRKWLPNNHNTQPSSQSNHFNFFRLSIRRFRFRVARRRAVRQQRVHIRRRVTGNVCIFWHSRHVCCSNSFADLRAIGFYRSTSQATAHAAGLVTVRPVFEFFDRYGTYPTTATSLASLPPSACFGCDMSKSVSTTTTTTTRRRRSCASSLRSDAPPPRRRGSSFVSSVRHLVSMSFVCLRNSESSIHSFVRCFRVQNDISHSTFTHNG